MKKLNCKLLAFKKFLMLFFIFILFSSIGYSQANQTYLISLEDANNSNLILTNQYYPGQNTLANSYYYTTNFKVSGNLTLGGTSLWFYNYDSKATVNGVPCAYYSTNTAMRLSTSFNLQGNIAIGNSATISCDVYKYNDIPNPKLFTTNYTVKIISNYAPTNLSVSSISPIGCTLNWSASSGTGITYKVYESINGGSYTNIASSISTTSYTISNLCPNNNYRFYVTANNTIGESSASNITNTIATPVFSISGPESLCSGTAYTVNGATTYVTWTLSSNIKSYYGGTNYVAVNPNGTGTGTINASVTPTGCATSVLPTKTISVGVPATPSLTFTRDGSNCEYYAYTPQIPGATYYWSLNGSSWISGSSNTFGSFAPPIIATVYLKVVTSCGTSPIKTLTRSISLPAGCMW